jgi:hypothetical protein
MGLARIGPTQTIQYGSALVGVCAFDVAAGLGLWRGRRWAGRLGLATTPFALALGLGFELPFLLAGVPVRVALTVGVLEKAHVNEGLGTRYM